MEIKDFSNLWENLKKIYPEDNRIFTTGVKEEYFNELKYYNFDLVRGSFNKEMARQASRYAPTIESIKSHCIHTVMAQRERGAYKDLDDNERAGQKTIKQCIDEFMRKHLSEEEIKRFYRIYKRKDPDDLSDVLEDIEDDSVPF